MKRSHKLLALANKNYTQSTKSSTKPTVSNKVLKYTNESYLENWTVNDDNVEVDLNAINQIRPDVNLNKDNLNGVNINDFDIVFEETITNDCNSFLKEANINEENRVIEQNAFPDTFDEIVVNNDSSVLEPKNISDILLNNIQLEGNNDNLIQFSRCSKKLQTKNRVAGTSYIGYKLVDGKLTKKCVIDGREIKPRCKHSEKVQKTKNTFLCGLFSEEDRKRLFKQFWSFKTWDEKKGYVRGLVQTREIVRRRKLKKNKILKKKESKNISLPLGTEKRKVCRHFFLSTLCLGEDSFKRWTKSYELVTDSETEADELPDGKTNNSQSTTNENSELLTAPRKMKKIQSVIKIKEWLELLPKVPSHYCRKSTSKLYVESTFFSLSDMIRVYSAWIIEQGFLSASKTLFLNTLKSEKISIHKPRKDQCDVCCGHKNGTIEENEYNAHLERKNLAREEKNHEKSLASNTKIVITMDLESVLLCPLTNASAMYYKQKLQVHNFTIYRLHDHDVTLYVWHESNGHVTANEFTSCIIDYISNLTTEVKEVTLISDGCNYQNRNKTLASTLSMVAKKKI